jgi:hypothetical protein
MKRFPTITSAHRALLLAFGIIVLLVLLAIRTDKGSTDPCFGKDDQCRKLYIERIVQGQGPQKALAIVAGWYDENTQMGGLCHDLTHLIGRAAEEEFSQGKDIEASEKMAYCSYGFYHGFMEALVSRGQDMDEAQAFCQKVDAQLSQKTPDASLQCFHGIGHGTVNNHDPATWGSERAMIDPAIALCEQAAGTKEERSRCATGVFNGIAMFYLNGQYELAVNTKDPLWICREYSDVYRDACYMSMNIVLLDVAQGDLGESARFIEEIPEDEMAAHAMINLSAPISLTRGTQDSREVFATCRTLQERLRTPCIQGYAYGFLEHGRPGHEYREPLALCASTDLTPEEQEGCFTYIFGYFRQWYAKEKIKTICADIEKIDRAKQCELIALTQQYEQ